MDESTPLVEIARFLRRLQWIVATLAVLWLVGLLAPVLTPFVLGALLGGLGDPLVDRLVASGRSRGASVTLVFTGMVLGHGHLRKILDVPQIGPAARTIRAKEAAARFVKAYSP